RIRRGRRRFGRRGCDRWRCGTMSLTSYPRDSDTHTGDESSASVPGTTGVSAADGQALRDGWRDAVLVAAAHFQLNASPEHIRLASQWGEGAVEEGAREMARQAGLSL